MTISPKMHKDSFHISNAIFTPYFMGVTPRIFTISFDPRKLEHTGVQSLRKIELVFRPTKK